MVLVARDDFHRVRTRNRTDSRVRIKCWTHELSAALNTICLPTIWNAAFHADYTLGERGFHMTKNHYLSPQGYLTRDIPCQNS